MTLLVGLTGGIGSGKSTVADRFAALGVPVVDTDEVSRELTAAGGAAIPAIRAAFGDAAIDAAGAMDRTAMRERVFADPQARQRLEAILHPMIAGETQRRLAAAEAPYRIVAVPLLVETGHWLRRVDRVLVIDCPPEVQVARVMRRNGLPEAQVRAVLAAQATREARLAAADDVIDNAGSPDALDAPVRRLDAQYRALAGATGTANRDGSA